MVVLARVGHAAAGEKRPPQERRLTAVVFEHGEVDMVRDRAREVGAEGGKHRLDGGAVGDGQHMAAAGLFGGGQGKVRAERAAKELRQPLGQRVARRDDADLARRERVAVQQHAVSLGHGAAVAAERHAAQLVFDIGCKGHGAPPLRSWGNPGCAGGRWRRARRDNPSAPWPRPRCGAGRRCSRCRS